MCLRILTAISLLIPQMVLAGIVVYTDTSHPPINQTDGVTVVWLDGPARLQRSIFGRLPVDPQLAEQQARQIFHSPQWVKHQAEMVDAYQQVVAAWGLGLRKYPAVVFDGQDVVYGTADVAQAEKLRNEGRN